MSEAEKLSVLTGMVYDAALEPALWPIALGKVANFVGGVAAGIYSKDVNKNGHIYYDDGKLDPSYVRLYFEKYIRFDPSTTGHFFAEIGEPVSTSDVLPYNEFVETRFYKEWAQPQGLVDFVSAILDKSATSIASFGVFRDERDGLVDDEARNRMRLVVPHVRRSVLIGKILGLKTAEAATLTQTLDGISAGMFLVDSASRIIHANAAGHTMLAAGDVLRSLAGRLAVGTLPQEQTLQQILAAPETAGEGVGAQGSAVPLIGRDGKRYVAHVLPLTSGRRRQAGTYLGAAAALFVHKATVDTPSLPTVIARHFCLTPTELRVLLAVVEVGGAPEVADVLGVAETTVRFHLRHLFEKTDTHRQADLVRLVAGFANPLIG